MDLLHLLLRTVLVYFVVFLVMRIMGKREIGKLSVFDLVISIIIADIAVMIVEDNKKSLLEGLLPIAMLVFIQISFAYLMMKSEKLRELFDGKPSVLIANGKINHKEMRKQRYTLDDLLLQTRLKDIDDLSKVEFAILETNGSLSIMEKQNNQSNMTFPYALVMDGVIQKDHLESIGKDEHWLRTKLREKGVINIENIFYCSLTTNGDFYIQLK